MTAVIHKALAQKALLPEQHVVDMGYIDADLLVWCKSHHQVDLLGPIQSDSTWQARTPNAFDISQFQIDWENERVTCPIGQQSFSWTPSEDAFGNAVIRVLFDKKVCRSCMLREHCTRAKKYGRGLTLRPQSLHEAIVAARRRQTTDAFKTVYAKRAGIEGTISQGVRSFGLRRSRYIGEAKTHLQHILTAAAINVCRLYQWLLGVEREQTRCSHFAALGT